MDGYIINNYFLDKPLSNNNSGFSKWGIGKRDGQQYFVKEFLYPTYPADRQLYSDEQIAERMIECDKFVKDRVRLYSAIREIDDGHLVSAEQFFRIEAKYYLTTVAYTRNKMSVEDIAHEQFADKLRLCCMIAHSMMRLHSKKIVHSDIKPDNIIVIKNTFPEGYIIDFDCGFFEDNCPEMGEELNGDFVYFSPEAFLHVAEIESKLSCKIDVFALGLVFCQYFTGELPGFDHKEYQYAYEAVLDDKELDVSKIENTYCRELVHQMLVKDQEIRKDMKYVFNALNAILLDTLGRKKPENIKIENNELKNIEPGLFFEAGDLS